MHPLLSTFLIAVVLNLVVFVFAFRKQTDHFTDFTYSLTFVLVAVFSFLQTDIRDLSKIILLVLVISWAVRLGAYLFSRIKSIGVDHRFDEMRPVWYRYIGFWILQGTSVWLIATPFIIALSSNASFPKLNWVQYLGLALWLFGFLLESIADYQKSKFRSDSKNDGQFMASGLFSIVRYPNYLGEMLVWIGIFVFCIPYLSGLEWISVLSPLWIIVLLLFISGIPYLKKQSEKRYGHLAAYQTYKQNTKKLIPFVF